MMDVQTGSVLGMFVRRDAQEQAHVESVLNRSSKGPIVYLEDSKGGSAMGRGAGGARVVH
jgi:hypothetical protein